MLAREAGLDLEGSDGEAEPGGVSDVSGTELGRRVSALWPGRQWPLLRGGLETPEFKGSDLWEGAGTWGAASS